MPRRTRAVKEKFRVLATSPGLIDLHFHGAFGIDLMRASPGDLEDLRQELWLRGGVAGFCPTTLSAPPSELAETVSRLGAWIRTCSPSKTQALPFGIHLEGPFISPGACGAHPQHSLRPLDLQELERLWELSQKTLKILTFAPERLTSAMLLKLGKWARARAVRLSIGHSQATELQTHAAIQAGVSGITHAWNASGFHTRAPGPLGAALGEPSLYLELIIDQVHLSPTLIRWTQKLHPKTRICYVSDAAPAAGLKAGSTARFGPLRVQLLEGACRLENGHLAGGGLLLGPAFGRWVESEAKMSGQPVGLVLRRCLMNVCSTPLQALMLKKAPHLPRLAWGINPRGRLAFRASDSI